MGVFMLGIRDNVDGFQRQKKAFSTRIDEMGSLPKAKGAWQKGEG